MSNEKISLKDAESLYKVVQDANRYHQNICDGLADAVIWNNVAPTKKGGLLSMERLMENSKYFLNVGEIRAELEYWEQNYDAIKSQVFYRKHPQVDPSEITGKIAFPL